MVGNQEVAQIREKNGQALHWATSGEPRAAYTDFKAAIDISSGLDGTDPETAMARADTLRDWAMTYARDAASSEDPAERQQLFEASDYVFDRALSVTELFLAPYAGEAASNQTSRLKDTHFVAHSVRARAHHLRKIVTGEPWGDVPDFGIANRGMRPSYWSASNSMHALSYIRSKDKMPNETVETSKSTVLHMLPWLGRVARQLPGTFVTATVDARSQLRSQQPLISEGARFGTNEFKALQIGFIEMLKATKHTAGIAVSLRTKRAARATILRHP